MNQRFSSTRYALGTIALTLSAGCAAFARPQAPEPAAAVSTTNASQEPISNVQVKLTLAASKALPLEIPVSIRYKGTLSRLFKVRATMDGSEVVSTTVKVDSYSGGRTTITLPKPGNYTIVTTLGTEVYDTDEIEVITRKSGGEYFAVEPTRASIQVQANASTQYLYVPGWMSMDQDAYRIEWKRDGNVLAKQEGRASTGTLMMLAHQQVNNAAPDAWTYGLHMKVPDNVIDKPGQYEIVVTTMHNPPMSVALEVSEDRRGKDFDGLHVKTLTVDEVARKSVSEIAREKPSIPTKYPVTDQELRALTRSPELVALRLKLNQADHVGAHSNNLTRKDGESRIAFLHRQDDADKKRSQLIDSIRGENAIAQAKIWKQMQPLIQTFGGPWTPEEIPVKR